MPERRHRQWVERFEHLPALYRDSQGRIEEVAYPRSEPGQDDLAFDLYASSYGVVKGLLGPPKLRDLEIVIFNTRGYRPDPGLEEEARARLLRAIRDKEGDAVIASSGGEAIVRAQITVTTWFAEKPRR